MSEQIEMFSRRVRILAGSKTGHTGIAVGHADPRVAAHPQPGHKTWDVFVFLDEDGPLTGDVEQDGHGLGYRADEVEFLEAEDV